MAPRPSIRCVHCELRLARCMAKYRLGGDTVLFSLVQRWVYPRDISEDDVICQSCKALVTGKDIVVHRELCLACGRSIKYARRQPLHKQREGERDIAIRNVVAEWIAPRQISPCDKICMPCWLKARIEAIRRQNIDTDALEGAERDPAHEDAHQPNESVLQEAMQHGPDQEDDAQQADSDIGAEQDPAHEDAHQPNESVSQEGVQHGPDQEDDAQQAVSDIGAEQDLAHEDAHQPNESVLQEGVEHGPNQEAQQADSDVEEPDAQQDGAVEDGAEGANNQARRIHNDEPRQYITLPNLRRAADTSSHCLFFECAGDEKYRVPDVIRKRILKDFNFYIPPNSRICRLHMSGNYFHELYASENTMSTFSAAHIEEMVFLLSEEHFIDFGHPENIDDHLFKYWFGRTKREYQQILSEVPRLNSHKMKCGLNALLCKMRTGDSDERIAALFQMPRTTLEGYMKQATDILLQDYVPRHLGWSHVSRQEIVSRNTILAEHLFGNPEASDEEKQLIVIADGTYLATQKSSNYLFQKETFSLHKHYNLVKPFLICCCDGYIIEAVGPYPATKNDASIMEDLLEEGGFVHMRENDIFILDRSFRDCADKLMDRGFQVHIPETIEEGDRQLTTLQANISRCITMNRNGWVADATLLHPEEHHKRYRWVIEAVNGRFSRDFKIFRQEYFNKRCPQIMKEFSIAAALLNHFAQQFVERQNVYGIIDAIHENIFKDNELATVVRENNINMRQAMFQTVTRAGMQFPRLSIEDLTMISLGTYQIRQAKSYVGEHFRAHGMYTIEVCTEYSVFQELSLFHGNDTYLLRGKIKSRYVGSKTYFVYIVVDRMQQGRNAILAYYCHCAAGKRTVGCCSHVMSILWYMGYARHQGLFQAPAAFLDDLLIR